MLNCNSAKRPYASLGLQIMLPFLEEQDYFKNNNREQIEPVVVQIQARNWKTMSFRLALGIKPAG